MLKYLIIQLDDSSTSFCHYPAGNCQARLMPLDVLLGAIRWAMTENLMVQFVYPAYELPAEWNEAIESVDHVKIKPSTAGSVVDADVVVFDKIEDIDHSMLSRDKSIVVRTSLVAFFQNHGLLRHRPFYVVARQIDRGTHKSRRFFSESWTFGQGPSLC